MPPAPAIVVDWSASESVYSQIVRQIRCRIAAGEIAPGTLLPSVRTLASDLGVNLNTVARAYRVLEDEGFVVLRDRRGAEVAAPARRGDRETLEDLRTQLGAVLARMRQAGLVPAELRRCAEQEIAGLVGESVPGKESEP